MKTKNMKMRGQRNNNPLNIKYVKTTVWVGQVRDIERSDKVFVEFTDMKYGLRAAIKLLRRYIALGFDRVHTIIYRWCPDHTARAYEQTVIWRMRYNLPKFDPDKPIDRHDRDTLYQLVRAMAWVESRYEVTRQEFDEAWLLV